MEHVLTVTLTCSIILSSTLTFTSPLPYKNSAGQIRQVFLRQDKAFYMFMYELSENSVHCFLEGNYWIRYVSEYTKQSINLPL